MLNPSHNKNNAINPVRKLIPADCGINDETIKATIAMLHHGRNMQAAKLNKAIRIIDTINFILSYELSVMSDEFLVKRFDYIFFF